MKTGGCVAQYEENSVKDWDDKINGGAVRDERSPLNEAIDLNESLCQYSISNDQVPT